MTLKEGIGTGESKKKALLYFLAVIVFGIYA